MSSNLPPGVTAGMIPGNRPEDMEMERVHEMIAEDAAEHGWDAEEVEALWRFAVTNHATVLRSLHLVRAADQAMQDLLRVRDHVVDEAIDEALEALAEIDRTLLLAVAFPEADQ